MIVEPLTNDNFVLYCARHYSNNYCSSLEEFQEDIKRIRYIKKLITKFELTGECKERLILNHIIILSNLFEPEHLCRILYFKLPLQFSCIKPFLILLNILPNKIYCNEQIIDMDAIPMNQKIIEILRKI